MLPKRGRLKNNAAFQEAFRRGKPFFFQGLGCRVLSGQERTLVGFAVSKKAYPRAVDRNRAKRLLAEAVRKHAAKLPTDTWIVFTLSKPPESLTFPVFERMVSGILRNMR